MENVMYQINYEPAMQISIAKGNSKLRSWKKLGVQCAVPPVIDEKMEKTRNRTWKKQDNGAYHHTNKESE